MAKSKEEVLAALKKKKQKKNNLDSKVESSMGVSHSDIKGTHEGEGKPEPKYSSNSEMEKVARKIYNDVIDQVSYALKKKGVQIAQKADFKKVLYKDKNYIKKIHELQSDGFIYAFPLVDTNNNYEKTGMMFQKVVTKGVKTK